MKTLALVLIFLTSFQLCLSQEERPLGLALNNGGCGQCQIEACRTPSSFECLAGKKYILDAATSSGILNAKQKLGRTFNSDKLGGIAFTKISKLTMCSA